MIVTSRDPAEYTRLGLEGLITFHSNTHTFDADNFSLSIPVAGKQVQVAVFDKVVVEIAVETDKNTLRGKVVMELVEPVRSKDI